MEIKQTQTSELIPYINNARTHSSGQVSQIAASIKEFGFNNPILCDGDNGVIAGHGRLMAAQKLGLEKVPVIELSHLSKTQKKAFILADNKLAENAGWDDALVQVELEALSADDFEVGLTGFDFDPPCDDCGGEADDEVPEVPDEPTTKLGDLWILGNHRLLCGDSTDAGHVSRLMGGEKADMVFTDPPYNIDFKPQRGTHGKIKNDNMPESDFEAFLYQVFSQCKAVLHPDTYLISFMGWSTIHNFRSSLKDLFEIKSMPIWKKNNFGIGYYTRPQYEPFFLCLNGNPVKPQKAPSDVFEYAKVQKTIHSCEKPVGLITEIVNYFNRNGLFYEPFSGSGSTMIACEKTNRKCYGMELDPHYCDVIIKRWEDYTGQKAVLDGR